MKSREQQFAAAIYPQVKTILDENNDVEQKKYGAMAHKLPILIRSAGLAQAVAFVQSRGQGSQKALLADLAQVVKDESSDAFAQRCRDAELADYMALTEQTLLALSWYKRFAQSVLKVDASEDGGEDHAP